MEEICLRLSRYQQNYVNGETFNIRSRSLNGALYWIAQMAGGLIIGMILDLPFLSRPNRARAGWAFLFITGKQRHLTRLFVKTMDCVDG